MQPFFPFTGTSPWQHVNSALIPQDHKPPGSEVLALVSSCAALTEGTTQRFIRAMWKLMCLAIKKYWTHQGTRYINTTQT